MTPGSLAVLLAWLLDLTALGALASTTDVHLAVFGAVAALFVAHRLTRLEIGNAALLLALTVLSLGGLAGWLWLRMPPILAAAHAAPLVHAFIWFMPEGSRGRSWRMSVGFAELILASALTPEFYLLIAIFAFVVVAAVTASCNFLEVELRRRSADPLVAPLPRGFIRNSLVTAFVIFLSSLLIFPVLPRMKVDVGAGGSDLARIGYTEDVTLVENLRFSESPDSGTPLLWLYPRQPGEDLSLDIHLGLIRGKSLDAFDGRRWSSIDRPEEGAAPALRQASELKTEMEIDAVRGPLASHVLPVPYGTLEARASPDGPRFRRMRAGEWLDRQGGLDQISYTVRFVPYDAAPFRALGAEAPVPANSWVPPGLRTERMQRLARTVFGEARTEREKLQRLSAYFRSERFQASLGEGDGLGAAAASNPWIGKMHPLERFLFISRRGHCEWFATASAMLLRFAGVPTRLVAGFRITHGPVGGVLTVRSSDAHAWVEFWQEGRGWLPYDPTPRIIASGGWLGPLRGVYDWISGYWYRYILSFRDASQGAEAASAALPAMNSRLQGWGRGLRGALREHAWSLALGLAASLPLLAGAYLYLRWKYPWVLSIRYRVREGTPRLRRERIRMERWIARRVPGADPDDPVLDRAIEYFVGVGDQETSLRLREWGIIYLRLRFGGEGIPAADFRALSELRARISRTR